MNKAKEMFNEWAVSYDHYLDTSPFYQDLIAELVNGAAVQDGMNVLDIGVGTGRISSMILEKANCVIDGIDVSAEMLDEARKNLGEKCKLHEMDVCGLNFEDNTFNSAFAAFAVHHVPDDEKIACLKGISKKLSTPLHLEGGMGYL